MSDIDIVEILTKIHQEENERDGDDEVISETPIKQTNGKKTPANVRGDWTYTRTCWCPYNAPTDCRFHPMTEPGWEVCPHKDKVGLKPRSLYINSGVPKSDEELSVGADIKELSLAQQKAADKFLTLQ